MKKVLRQRACGINFTDEIYHKFMDESRTHGRRRPPRYICKKCARGRVASEAGTCVL